MDVVVHEIRSEDGDPDHQCELVLAGRRDGGGSGRVTHEFLLVWWWSCRARWTSSSTRSALIAMAAADPSPAAVMTWARGLAALPATQTPATLVRPVGSVVTHPCSSMSQPRP